MKRIIQIPLYTELKTVYHMPVPKDATFVHAGRTFMGDLYAWFEIDQTKEHEIETKRFVVVPTGHLLRNEYIYRSSFIDSIETWHLYELPNEED